MITWLETLDLMSGMLLENMSKGFQIFVIDTLEEES